MIKDIHMHFCNGVFTYGGALWAIRILSILLHCTNPWNLLKLQIAPMNPFFTYHKFHQIMQQLMALGIFEMF
jgi:hypothetical protein